MSKLRLKQLAQDGAVTGQAAVWDGTKWAPAAAGGLGWFDVTAYGAVHNGSTDDTTAVQAAIDACAAAGGGVVYFPAGVYIIGGALQDTSRSNSQLRVPAKNYVTDEQITVRLLGAAPPPAVMSVIGTTPIPDNLSVIKGTLNSGAGGSLLGGWGPSGSTEDFTNILLQVQDLTFRLPSNPVLTALNLSHVAAVELDDVVVDVGSYYVQGLTQPTTSTSFGIRLPGIDNGACTRLGVVNVIGFYKGLEVGEHTHAYSFTAWGCNQAAVFITAYHASNFQRLMAVHCPRGIVVTGTHYFEVDQYNTEHAASGWWVPVYDIDDASNLGHGAVTWHAVLAGSGVSSTFTVNSASNLLVNRLGVAPASYTDPLTTKGDLLTHSATVTARLGVGTDGQVVTADSTATNGIKWATPATSSAGAGELLMQDGVTAPPVPIETEARDDWLYSG